MNTNVGSVKFDIKNLFCRTNISQFLIEKIIFYIPANNSGNGRHQVREANKTKTQVQNYKYILIYINIVYSGMSRNGRPELYLEQQETK